MFPEHIETDRLELEHLDESIDALELYAYCSAEGMNDVTKYMPFDPHATPKETEEFLDGVAERWDEREGAAYAIRPKTGEENAGEFAGVGTLHPEWDRQVGKLGTWLRKPFWGRGYSGERAVALANVAFETLDLKLVEVTHHAANEKSERAVTKYMEELGGRREGLLRGFHSFDGEPVDAVRYTVTREEYEAATEPETVRRLPDAPGGL
jgi:RimJ/RimL family protein N-acetyltransferase